MTTVRKDVLSKAIGTAIRAVGSNPVVPLLGNVLLESKNGKSRVAGTNLEMGIGYTFPSSGEEWKTCVPARVFASLVDALGSDEVELQQDPRNQSIIIMTDSSTSNLHCAPADEFPDIPTVTRSDFSLPVVQFKEMIQRIAFCSMASTTGSPLEGVQLGIEDGKLAMFAVDGFHLSYENTPLFKQGKGSEPFLVKGTTLETISRTLPDEGILEVQVESNKAMFHCGSVDIIVQLLDGKFPSHQEMRAAITTPNTTVTLSTMDLLRAARQLRVISTEVGMSKLEVKGMLLRYSTLAQERGDTDVTFMAVKQGSDVTIGLSVHLLHEFLEICKTSQVVMEVIDAKNPILFKMPGLDSFYHVIMPITL